MKSKKLTWISLISIMISAILVYDVYATLKTAVPDINSLKIQDSANEDIYLVNRILDLKGSTIKLPPQSKLRFDGGMLLNGTVIGDSTEIECQSECIFDAIRIAGSWKVDTIKTDMFRNSDNYILENISSLASDRMYNYIELNEDCYCSIKEWDSNFVIKSNSTVILNADIYTLPTDKRGGYTINIKGENVTLRGNNHFLYGTIGHKEQIRHPEFLHGLNISTTARNIIVDSLNSWLFCGDGFYNAGSNVTLKNVNAKFNGRQGLSITNGRNIKVENSSFTYTGYLRINDSKGPGAGIDIEPNMDSEVHDVVINNCVVGNNYKYMKNLPNDIEIYGCKNGNIKILNTVFQGLYLGSCSKILINNCTKIDAVYKINQDVSEFVTEGTYEFRVIE